MSDEIPQDGKSTNEGQAPDEPVQDTGDTTPQTFSLEYVKELRQEAAKYRTQLKAKEKQEQDKRELELAEQQKWQELAEKREQDLQSLRAKLEEQTIKTAFSAAAAAANIQKVDTAMKLADLSNVSVGEDGTVSGIEQVVEQVVQELPELVASSQAPTPKISPTNPGGSAALTMEAVKQMTTDEINANWEAVQEAMKRGN